MNLVGIESNDAGGARVCQDFAPIGVERMLQRDTGRGDVQSPVGTDTAGWVDPLVLLGHSWPVLMDFSGLSASVSGKNDTKWHTPL